MQGVKEDRKVVGVREQDADVSQVKTLFALVTPEKEKPKEKEVG